MADRARHGRTRKPARSCSRPCSARPTRLPSASARTCSRLRIGSRRVVGGGRTARGVVAARRRRSATPPSASSPTDRAVSVGSGMYHVVSVPLQLGERRLDRSSSAPRSMRSYARELADLSRGQAAILSKGAVLASTVERSGGARSRGATSTSDTGGADDDAGGRVVGDPAALAARRRRPSSRWPRSIAAADGQTQAALHGLAWVGLGAIGLAVLGSVWLARTLTQPIDQLSQSLSAMTTGDRARDAGAAVSGTQPRARSADRRRSTRCWHVGRVGGGRSGSDLSRRRARAGGRARRARSVHGRPFGARQHVSPSRWARSSSSTADAMETLRLGALLHDIGKIGVPDEVLRKPGALTAAEFETIKTHPSAGARILRSIPFLAPHIPIVELHHERPDGLGYPYGLHGDDDSAGRAHRARRRRVRRHDQRARVSFRPHSGRSDRGTAPLRRHRLRWHVSRGADRCVTASGRGDRALDPSAFQWAPRARSA